jgi:hypothetical protein
MNLIGIDKIKILLSPIWVNSRKIHFNKKGIMHIKPDNSLTLHKCGPYTGLAIHDEYISRYEKNLFYCISKAINELMIIGIIEKPEHIKEIDIFNFIFQNPRQFISHVAELEIYFSIYKDSIIIKKYSVETGYLIEVTDNETGAKTYYTKDYNKYILSNIKSGRKDKRKSIGKIYDKNIKDLKDNRKSHISILNNDYSIRLEFRLNNKNCNYMNIDNFNHSLNTVLRKYFHFLVVKYKKYFLDHVEIDIEKNKHLVALINTAKATTSKRFTEKTLKKTEPIMKEFLRPNQIFKQISKEKISVKS